MKKFTLFVAALMVSAMTFAADITWELNGGSVEPVVYPTNVDLWEEFKPYYNEYYGLSRADQPITLVSTFASAKMQQIMTDEASAYKWLGDYVLSVATTAGVTLSTDMANANEGGWRWALHAFFNANAGQHGATGIDFTEAGKPENWGPAWGKAHAVVLPESVDAEFTLPVVFKGHEVFSGWFDNAELAGEPLTTIPAGYKGTLYAAWGTPKYRIQVSVNIDAMGSVNQTDVTLEKGSVLELIATPNESYKFVKWSNGETANPLNLTVTEPLVLVAEFDYAAEPVIIWELNGGEIVVDVPADNEALYVEFKAYFNLFYNNNRDHSMDKLTTLWNSGIDADAKILTSEISEFKWLGDYITKVTNDQIEAGTLTVLTGVNTEVKWRFGLHAFFNQSAASDSDWNGNADFTEAGKPENWQPLYPAPILPTVASELPYALPVLTKEGANFVGWYDNAEGEGETMTIIPAYWYGTIYAVWDTPTEPTAVENIAINGKVSKAIINGQLVIIKEGIQYNILGAVVK